MHKCIDYIKTKVDGKNWVILCIGVVEKSLKLYKHILRIYLVNIVIIYT